MDDELQKKINALTAQLNKLSALVSLQNGLLAATIEASPNKALIIRSFVESTELLTQVLGPKRFSQVEIDAFNEARERLLATITPPTDMSVH